MAATAGPLIWNGRKGNTKMLEALVRMEGEI
jgi:hypothetical protein